MGIFKRRRVVVDLAKAAEVTMKEGNTNLPLRNYFLLRSAFTAEFRVFYGVSEGILSIY